MRARWVGSIAISVAAACTTPMPDLDAHLEQDASRDSGHDAAAPDASGDANRAVDAAPDTARDTGCPPTPACVGGELVSCTTGALVRTPCPAGCAADGSARCAEMDVSNVDVALMDPSAADVTFASSVMLNTSRCDAPEQIVMQGDGTEVCALIAHDVTVPASVSIGAQGSRALVILASGTVTIDGTVDVSAHFTFRGAGGGNGGSFMSVDGDGLGHGTAGTIVVSSASGGGGGAFGGAGGAGGGGGSIPSGGAGGSAMPSVDLIPLRGGGGGSVGVAVSGTPAYGGAGGGAVQISSLVAIHVSGSIYAGGGGGDGGGNAGPGSAGAGAGGGSGGGILLEAPVLDVSGIVWTAGGAGGGASGTTAGSAGSNGNDLRGLGPAIGGAAGGMLPGAGGNGGALAAADGLVGETNGTRGAYGGGGGGGSGCIVLRDASGSYVPDAAARLSPTAISSLPLLLR